MDDDRRTALLAAFDQSMSSAIDATIAQAAEFDHLSAADAVFAVFEGIMASPGWDRETLAMAYAQHAVRLRRGSGDPRVA